MKKTAFKFASGSGTILAFLILVVVFASIAGVVYVVISQSSGKTLRAAGASSLTCTFSPSSVDVGKSVIVTSNRGNVFGEITIQGAYLATAIPLGTLAKQSSTTAVIPSVASGLYVVRVGSPAVNCKTAAGGDLAIQNAVLPTPTPVVLGASNLAIVNQTCSTDGRVNVAFHWTPQPDGAYFKKGAQLLDLSPAVGVVPFGTNNYLSHNVFGLDSYTTSTAAGNIGPLASGTVYFWRINTLNSLNSVWYPSKTPQFTTINCVALPTPTPPTISAACYISPSSVAAGGSITVTGKGFTGLTYTVNLLGSSTTQFYTLGQFNGNLSSYTIPATVASGVYTVRVFSDTAGNNGTMCTPDLVVN